MDGQQMLQEHSRIFCASTRKINGAEFELSIALGLLVKLGNLSHHYKAIAGRSWTDNAILTWWKYDKSESFLQYLNIQVVELWW